MPDYFNLKGIKDIKESTLNNEIQDGIIEYFDWALLGIGNYYNVTYAEQSPYDQDYSKLRLSSDPNYSEGQVWEGFRSIYQITLAYRLRRNANCFAFHSFNKTRRLRLSFCFRIFSQS